MKNFHWHWIFFAALACNSLWGQAQPKDTALEEFNRERLVRNERGMLILGSWALGNMALSGSLLSSSQGHARGFHQMNIGWNAVNLTIAGIGYYGALHGSTALGLSESLQEHENMQRILLFNAGLDLAYVAGGFYLRERAKNETARRNQFEGFGRAVIMNGAFLFAFDIIKFWMHQRAGQSALYPLLENLQVGVQGVGLRLTF